MNGDEHGAALADALAAFAAQIHDGIERAAKLGDAGTSDLFTEIARARRKHPWFVEAPSPSREWKSFLAGARGG